MGLWHHQTRALTLCLPHCASLCPIFLALEGSLSTPRTPPQPSPSSCLIHASSPPPTAHLPASPQSHILTSAAASLLRTKPGVRPPPSASAVLTGSPPGPPTSTPRPSSPIPGPSVTPATPSAAAAVETLRSASQRVVMAERIAQSLVQRCTGLRVDVNRVAGGGALADEAAREADAAGDAPAADAVREAANALRAALSKAEGPMAQVTTVATRDDYVAHAWMASMMRSRGQQPRRPCMHSVCR